MKDTIYCGDLIVTKSNAKAVALTSVGSDLFIEHGITFDYSRIEFGAGEVLAVLEYALHFKDGFYRAGCRGPWTADQALSHWAVGHHAPDRAKLFRETIEKHQASA